MMMTRTHIARLVAVAAVGALALSGCTGGTDEPGDGQVPSDQTAPTETTPTDQTTAPEPGEQPDGPATMVEVVGLDRSMTVSASALTAGIHTFVFLNSGSMGHDMVITGPGVDEGTPVINPGETAELTVTLEPGTYEVWCSVPTHRGRGMLAIIEVS